MMEPTGNCLQLLDDSSEAKFDLLQGAIAVKDQAVAFWSARGVKNLFVGTGRCFDFTCGLGGADRLFLQGSSADHQVDACADVLTLRHAAAGTEIRLHASRGPRELVFDDGPVLLGSLWRSTRQAAAFLSLLGETAACAQATVASHVTAGARLAMGALPEGALLQLEGFDGIETVYAVSPDIEVQFGGRLAEHKARLAGRALALSRRSDGLMETAYVLGQARLVFADGGVQSETMQRAVQYNEPWPIPHGQTIFAVPRITAVALDVDSSDIEWSQDRPEDLPSGLFGGCRAGQVFEASVSLEEAVEVEGAPRLHLCVGGRHRAALFSGGSGTDTLRFLYTVTEEDVAQAVGSQTRGLTLTGSGNLDVEIGPVLPVGATIRTLQPAPISSNDNEVAEVQDASLDESGWQSLIDESERRLAVALAALDECPDDVMQRRRRRRVRPDLELELLLDIDLVCLESAADVTTSFQQSSLTAHMH